MNQVKMAMLGCGGFSGEHARRYKAHPEVDIVALCDVNAQALERYVERHLADAPRPAFYTDFEALLREQKPDAVTIVTPHTLHFEGAMTALSAGCHVYIEKPMVTDSNDALTLHRAANASGKVLVVGYNTPSHPHMQWVRAALRQKLFGELQTVTGWLAQSWKKGTSGSWRQNPALSGGGQMIDSGAHLFNSLMWSIESPVESVFALIDEQGTPVDINGAVALRFANGALGSITVSGNSRGTGSGLVYACERGRIEIDGWNASTLRAFTGRDEEFPIEIEGEFQRPNDNFIDAIRGRAQSHTSTRNGVLLAQLMDAIYESARTGMPASPRFTLDEEGQDQGAIGDSS